MPISVTHQKVSAIADDPVTAAAGGVLPSDWNNTHTLTGLGTGVETFLETPTSANLRAALTDETGTGAAVFANTPTLVTPVLGTPTSGTLTNCTGLPIAGGTTGTLGETRGGTGQTTYATGDLLYASGANTLAKLAAGTNTHVLTLTGGVPTWAAPTGGGGVTNNFAATSAPTVNDDTGDGYAVGSLWVWAARASIWQCTNATSGAAVWVPVERIQKFQAGGPSAFQVHFEHFQQTAVPGGGQLGTFTENGSTFSTTSYNTGLDGQIGVLAVRTAASGSLQRPTFGSTNFIANVSGGIRNCMAARVKFRPSAASSAPSATNDYMATFGFQTGGSARTPNDMAKFDYYWSGSAVVFEARRRNAGGSVASTSLTLPTADAWTVLAVFIEDGAVELWQDGVLIIRDTSTVPTGAVNRVVQMNQTTAAAVCGMDVDWLAFWSEGHPG